MSLDPLTLRPFTRDDGGLQAVTISGEYDLEATADRFRTEYSMHIVHRFDRTRIDRDEQVAGLEASDGRRCIGFDVHDFHGALTG